MKQMSETTTQSYKFNICTHCLPRDTHTNMVVATEKALSEWILIHQDFSDSSFIETSFDTFSMQFLTRLQSGKGDNLIALLPQIHSTVKGNTAMARRASQWHAQCITVKWGHYRDLTKWLERHVSTLMPQVQFLGKDGLYTFEYTPSAVSIFVYNLHESTYFIFTQVAILRANCTPTQDEAPYLYTFDLSKWRPYFTSFIVFAIKSQH
jgi:hypothetical protein